MTMTWMEFMIAFALGWFLGSLVTRVWLHWTFREILRDLGVTENQLRDLAVKSTAPLDKDQDSELPVMEVKIEQHQGTLYAFRKDTDQFLAQGTDRDALIQRLTENLSNVRVVVAREDGADLIQKG